MTTEMTNGKPHANIRRGNNERHGAAMNYTIEEARRILRIGRNTAYEAARSGAIPTIRIGRRIIVPGIALERLLGAGTTMPAVQSERAPDLGIEQDGRRDRRNEKG
jgi:excisionase family DNA binding protein